MQEICKGRVCVVTGAGSGIGRLHALTLARHGAAVVVNDLGTALDGTRERSAAEAVVADIRGLGGDAVANDADVADWNGAKDLIDAALKRYGRLDVLVNNAGIIRDRMLVNMTEPDWDDVIRVHLKGTFAPTHWAANHWREASKIGIANDARVINTTSASGIYGNVGQANYGAAKAGIAAFTLIASQELARYGVTVNALAPFALTRMTQQLVAAGGSVDGDYDPRWVATIATWLASEQSRGVTGRVFETSGDWLAVAEGWTRGPSAPAPADAGDVDEVARALLARARPNANLQGSSS